MQSISGFAIFPKQLAQNWKAGEGDDFFGKESLLACRVVKNASALSHYLLSRF
jgi:hypothetical protein